MKISKKILLIFVLNLIVSTTNSQDPISAVIAGQVVKDVIQKFSDQVEDLMTQATMNGDYLLEKNLNKVSLIIQNVEHYLSAEMDKRVDQLSQESQSLIINLDKTLNESMGNATAQLLEMERFINLDVNDFLSRVPFFEEYIFMSEVKGYSLVNQSRGFYTVELIGNAFKVENIDSVKVNGTTLSADLLDKGLANRLRIRIPVTNIAGEFKLTDVSRFTLQVNSWREKDLIWWNPFTWFDEEMENFYSYEGRLLMLPIYPVISYKATEYVEVNKWSDEEYTSAEGIVKLGLTDRKDEWKRGSMETSVPLGCLMLQDKVITKVNQPAGWLYINNIRFDDANNKVIADVGDQFHDRESIFTIQVMYRKPEKQNVGQKIVLTQNEAEFDSLLKFGTYTSPLSEGYKYFDLTLDMFNGQHITFTPSDKPKFGVAVNVEGPVSYKVLRVVVSDPFN